MIEYLSFNIAVDITGIIGLILLLFGFPIKGMAENPKSRKLSSLFLVLIFMLMADMFACIYRGNTDALVPLYLANHANFFLSYVLVCAFTDFLQLELKLDTAGYRLVNRIIYIVSLVMILFTLANPVHKQIFVIPAETALYTRGPLYFIIPIYSCIVIVACILEILSCRRASFWQRFPLLCYCFAPLIATGIQYFVYGPSLTNMSALFSALIIYSKHYFEQNQELREQGLELQNTRAAFVLAQIHPHFLFNSMATVMYLCDTDPQEAKVALQELSDYLHYKIPSLSGNLMVQFDDDMDFMQNYVKLEQRRFGDRLHIEYDIGYSDFQIPLLTLQPLVENAIRHGINKKPSGGTILIATRIHGDVITILVQDNGVGFDTSKAPGTNPKHIGINNVRTRVSALCGGTLNVTSTPGVGTTVEITLRKGTERK